MSWVGGGDDKETDRFPVDSLVKKLREVTDGVNTVCRVNNYHGQSLKCCEGIQTCFQTIQESFTTVKLQAIGNQNMHKACRRLTTDFQATNSCIVSWTGNCHGKIDTNTLSAPFQTRLDNLKILLNDHCIDLPPEGTTVKGNVVKETTTVTPKKTTRITSTAHTTVTSQQKATTTSRSTTLLVTTSTSQPTTQNATTTTTTKNTVVIVTQISTTYDPDQPNHPSNNRPDPSEEPSTTTSTSTSTSTTNPTSANVTTSGNHTEPFTASSTTTTINPALSTRAGGSFQTTDHTGPQELESDSSIIIISSVLGSILLLAVVVIFFFVLYKKRQQKNTESGGSFEPDGKPKFFSWLFRTAKNPSSVQTDTEIYAEIDEAFMEAVYKYNKEKPPIARDRNSSNSQFNMCYESTFSGDEIIASKDKLNTIENKPLPLAPLNPLALIRNENDAITSFQTDQSKSQDMKYVQDGGQMSKRGFVTRRLGFTDIKSDSSECDYVYIEAAECDNVFVDASPSDYDTAEYGRNPDRNIHQAPEQNYYSYIGYNNEQDAKQSVKEYRRSSSDVETHVYENHDTLMEY